MALAPLKLADISVGSALTENWGRPTSYFQRWLNDNNRRIAASFDGVVEVQQELALVVDALADVVDELVDQQGQIDDALDELQQQQLLLDSTISDIIGANLSGAILTDGSGQASWTHGFNPSFSVQLSNCRAFTTGTTIFTVQMLSVSGGPGGTLDLMFWDASGAPAASQYVPCTLHVGL